MRASNIITVATFCAIIYLPFVVYVHKGLGASTFGLWQIGQEKSLLKTENRARAQWPNTSTLSEGLVEYTGAINDYLQDHLAYRKELLSFFIEAKYRLLHMESSQQVIFGKSGWLFLRNGLRNAIGAVPKSASKDENWISSAKEIKTVVDSYGGAFLVVIIPDKPQVYPEAFPKQLKYKKDGRRATDLVRLLEQNGIDAIDLLPALTNAKNGSSKPLLYSKSDSHWTHKGALLSYQKIVERLNLMGEKFQPITEANFRKRSINFSGDLARMLNLDKQFVEKLDVWNRQNKYSDLSPEKNVLLFADSFYGRTKEFWPYNFSKVTCYHHNWSNINPDVVSNTKAEIVILMMIERGLAFSLTTTQIDSKGCA